jgi:hypothetical protein
MENLYTIGEYHVTSNKMDNCPLIGGQDEYEGWAAVISLFSIPGAALFWAMLYNLNPDIARIVVIGETLLLAVCVTILYGFNMTKNRCGIYISLRKRNTVIKERYYQFGDDAERDAEKIKSIVDKYTAKANTLNKFDEDEREKFERKAAADKKHSEDCCVRYKDVLEKVKQ